MMFIIPQPVYSPYESTKYKSTEYESARDESTKCKFTEYESTKYESYGLGMNLLSIRGIGKYNCIQQEWFVLKKAQKKKDTFYRRVT